MGEIAEMMIDGVLDEQTGEYIGEAVGYPRTMRPGRYNSVKKRKPKSSEHATEGENLGGLHLVGKRCILEDVGECEISDYVGRRGRKRYLLVDGKGNKHVKKFSCFTLAGKR